MCWRVSDARSALRALAMLQDMGVIEKHSPLFIDHSAFER